MLLSLFDLKFECVTEQKQLARKERKREVKELTLHPVTNSKTSLHVEPRLPQREVTASQLFYHRCAKGKEQHEFIEKALDLRHVEKRGEWQTSKHSSRSRSAKRFDSVSPIRNEIGMYKPVS